MGTNYFTVNSYDPVSHVTSAAMGGSVATLSAQYNSRQALNSLSYTAGGSTVWSKQYGWQANGNLDHTADLMTGLTRQYGYDGLNRVTGAMDMVTGTQTPASGGLSESISYDAFGNLWEAGNFTFWPDGYTASNRPYNGWNFDAAGNLLSDGLGARWPRSDQAEMSGCPRSGFSDMGR